MKQVPEKFCHQAIFQSSLSPLPDMSRRFLAVGLVVVLGVAVNNEPSDDNYDLDTPEYGVAKACSFNLHPLLLRPKTLHDLHDF